MGCQDVGAGSQAEGPSGYSERRDVDALTEEGVPTAHAGARWYASTVRKVLTG